jgi:hypothetical protein
VSWTRQAEAAIVSAAALRPLLVYGPWATLFALAAVLNLHDIASLDYWWHLRAGQLIHETGAVPTHDPLTYTVPGARWIDIHWLFQLGLHALHSSGGHAAVVVAQLGLVCLWLVALAPIAYRRERTWLSVGALVLMLLVAAGRLQPRPEIPSFVLLAWILSLLDRFERTPDRLVYAIVPLQLLWVNVHGLFAVGIALCAIHLVAELLRALGRSGQGLRVDRVRRLAAVTLLAVLVSLANPNGIDGALYPLQQLDMVGSAERRGAFGMLIDELQPTIGSADPIALGLFLALASLSLGSLVMNWRRVREADILLWVAFFYLALGANRNTALFAIVAAPLLVRNANEVIDARPRWKRLDASATPLALTLGLLLAVDVAIVHQFAQRGRYSAPRIGVAEGLNPIGAAEWIARTRPPAPIGHSMGDGGYLIWRLWPDYAVMSDGRLEVFGPDLLPRLQLSDPERFAALDAQYRFGAVLLNHRRLALGELVAMLQASAGWRLGYADDVSVAFVRGDSDATRWPQLDLDAPGAFAPLDGVSEGQARDRFAARAQLFVDLGRPDLSLQTWEAALARFPDLPEGQAVLAELRALAAQASVPHGARETDALATPLR